MLHFAFDYKPFIAIVGDIIDSKKLQDRISFQQKLGDLLSDINEAFGRDISSRFAITLGDEFQGLLHSGDHVTEIIEKIEREMYPVKIRFGIGIGNITTNINPNIPLAADGPAYHSARKMIDVLKANGKMKMKPKSTVRIEIDDEDSAAELINAVFSLSTAIKSKWTVRQREIIKAYVENEATQSDVAQELGINQSTVHKALISSDFFAYQQALQSVAKVLSYIKEK